MAGRATSPRRCGANRVMWTPRPAWAAETGPPSGRGARPPPRPPHNPAPNAVPNAYAIDKLGVAPCRAACPVGQRAQGYIALIAEGRYREAFRVIKEDNPFPSVCGRTCHHPCEGHCTRALVDEPVGIMSLKRFVMDS